MKILVDALRRKYSSPSDVLEALGLDSALLSKKENEVDNNELSPKAILTMGALAAYLTPKLAEDEKLPDLTPLVQGMDSENYSEQRQGVAVVLKRSIGRKLKLAEDENIDDVDAILMALDEMEPNSGIPNLPAKKKKKGMPKPACDEDEAADKAAADKAAADKKAAEDKAAADAAANDSNDEEEIEVDEQEETFGMDEVEAAIKAGVDAAIANQKAMRVAERVVRPYIGDIAMDEYETPADIYKVALDSLKIDVKDVHPSALRTILELQPKPSTKRREQEIEVAMDAAGEDDFAKMGGDLISRIGHV